ncbi:MAG TPA: sensor histidine kinase [Gammaproteobacteria bacterium]|nr:sensor histidine kinase [Gammaproteobacteria bacterium]
MSTAVWAHAREFFEASRSTPDAGGTSSSWRAEVLDVWLRIGAIVFPVTVAAVIALREPPRFDVSAVTFVTLAALIVLLRHAERMRFELRAIVTIAVFELPVFLLMARSGFALGGAAILISAIVLAALLFGRTQALVLLAVTSAVLLATAWIVVGGAPGATRFADSDPTRLINWVRMTLSLSVVTGALVAAIDHVVRRMDQKRAEIESVLARLMSSERALRTAYDELGRLHGTLMMAQEDEQRRIARELHDQFGQMLTALKLKLALRPKSPAGSASESEPLAIVDSLIDRTRKLCLDLRPPLLEDEGLMPALEIFLREQRAVSPVALTLRSMGPDSPVPRELEVACFRIVQEGVTNVLRHAAACNAEVGLDWRPGCVEITVRDDGCGFSPLAPNGRGASGRLGLIGMRERARSLGGTFAIESAPGAGTTLHATLPLSRQAAHVL